MAMAMIRSGNRNGIEILDEFGKHLGAFGLSAILVDSGFGYTKDEPEKKKRKKEPEELISELFKMASEEAACELFIKIANGESHVDIAREYGIPLETYSVLEKTKGG